LWQVARNRDLSANVNVQFVKLFTVTLRSRVNRRPGFIHENDEDVDFVFVGNTSHEAVGLARSRAVADRYTANVVSLNQIEECFLCAFEILLRLGQIDGLILEKLSRLIDDGNLASRPLPRVDSDHADRACGRRQQQRPKVFLEDFDGFGLGAFTQQGTDLVLNRGQEKSLVRVAYRAFQQRSKLRLRITHNLRNEGCEELVVVDID